MSMLIKKEKYFILLLLSTTRKQQLALVKSITDRQIQVIVQIVYNVIHGFRALPEKDKKKLQRHKSTIRMFIAKSTSTKRRKELLTKYLKYILLIIKPVIKEL
jgi:hypothetical protein